jgi:guanylate kinase
LEQRLRYRNTESEENIQKRLSKARFEMGYQSKFDVILVNEVLEDALVKAQKIVSDFIHQ